MIKVRVPPRVASQTICLLSKAVEGLGGTEEATFLLNLDVSKEAVASAASKPVAGNVR